MKSLIKREIVYFYIKRPLNFLWLFILNMIFFSAKGLATPSDISPSSPEYTFTKCFSLLIPLFIFAFIGGMSMDEIIHKEKVKKYFETLLAFSFSPFKILLSKIIASFIVLYSVFLFSFLFYVFLLKLSGSGFQKIFFEGKLYWINFLLFSPLLGISILNLEALFYFIFTDQRTSSLLSFFAFGFISFFILFLALASPYDFFLIFFLPIFSIVSFIGSILTIFMLLKIIPPENYLLKF
ncbi:MAG: hypothetical protein ABIM58_04800 [candidate division WOR-3 bacterium]